METINTKKMLLTAAMGCLLTTTAIFAQLPAPNGMPVLPPPAQGATPPPPPVGMMAPPPQQQLQQVTTYKGTVAKMNANDDYVYDGFYMLSNGDSLLVKFPPHLGAEVTGAVKNGASVSVSGVANVLPMGEKEIRMISVTVGNKTISDTGSRFVTPPAESYVSGTGKITQLQTNREGIVTGFIVDGKTILRIPLHVANQLNSVAKNNSGVAYTGMKKVTNNGEATAGDYAVIHCQTITVNGRQYLVR